MADPQAVELSKAYRLLNHGPTTLVTSAHAGRRNVMAAAWAMPLDFDPPKVLLVVDKQTHTRALIEAAGTFALNIPSRAQAAATLAVGSCSGGERDKFAEFDIATFPASQIDAPLVRDCLAWLECRIAGEPRNEQTYDLFIGAVVAAWADPEVFSGGRWHFPDDSRRSIHYQGGGNFFVTGADFEVSA